MNGFDIGLLILLGFLVFVGLAKGLARLLVGMGALVAAFWLAAYFHQSLALDLSWTSIPGQPLKLISYVLIFLATMLAGGLVAYLLRKLLKAAMLGWADRLAGGAVGLAAALLIAALLLLPLVAYSPIGGSLLRDSVLAPYVVIVADMANRLAPVELSESYRRNVEQLRLLWQERWRTMPETVNDPRRS